MDGLIGKKSHFYDKNMKDKLKILVLVDCQNDFIDGSLANPDAQKAIPNIVDKIAMFDGEYIFLTMDTHNGDYLDTPEGKKLPVSHCIYNTNGWKINSEVYEEVLKKAKEGATIKYITKPTFASILQCDIDGEDKKSLIEHILELEKGTKEPIPMEIEMCGFCTDICVISNALAIKGFTYDFAEITVDSKCCAGVTPEKHKAALEVMRSCQINVI